MYDKVKTIITIRLPPKPKIRISRFRRRPAQMAVNSIKDCLIACINLSHLGGDLLLYINLGGTEGDMANANKDSVKERRLRPIYELLDSNNNKRVVQEVDRLLKKTPGFTCAKVLKALALLRLQKPNECAAIITPIFDETPTDEAIIQALSICYRELDQPRMVCKLLERAIEKDKNEDLMTHCFMAHVRVSDFQKQHQNAIQLYKMYPKIPYFSWAVMSLLVKVERDTDPASLRVSLPLAERMMSKFIEDNKIESEHEYSLYILILRKQGNYDKILDIMTGPNGKRIAETMGFFHRIVIECLKKKKDDAALITFLEEAISQHPDEWGHYEQYILTFVETQNERVRTYLNTLTNKKNGTPGHRPVLLAQLLFIKSANKAGINPQMDITKILIEYVRSYGSKPFFFADIKFALGSVIKKEDIEGLLEAAQSMLHNPIRYLSVDDIQRKLNYVMLTRYFHSRATNTTVEHILNFVQMCVQSYLDARDEQYVAGADGNARDGLPQDEFMALAGMNLMETFWTDSSAWKGYFTLCQKKSEVIQPSGDVKGERGNLLEKLNVQQDPCDNCSHNSNDATVSQKPSSKNQDNDEENIDTNLSDITTLAANNDNNSHNCGAANAITNGFSNSLALNNVDFAPNEEDLPILLSMAILEFVLDKSPNLSQVRLLLAKDYIRCGAIGAGTDIVIGLDLKHIQWESLGYLYIWKLETSGFYPEAVRILHMAENFYTNYQKESMEHVLSAYKFGSWEKILEFLDFRDLLINSVQFGLITVEKELFQYTMSCYSHSQTSKVAGDIDLDQISLHFDNFERYTDNRDMTVLLTYGDKTPSKELRKLTFNAEMERLKIRSMILYLMTKFVLLPDKDPASFSSTVQDIEILLPNLQKLVTVDYSSYNIDTTPLNEMWAPIIYKYVSPGYVDLLLKLFVLNLEMAKEPKDERINQLTTEIEEAVKSVTRNSIKMWKSKISSFLTRADVIEDVFLLTETLGFCCILLDVCGTLVKKCLSVGKAKKKKSREALDSAYCQHFNSVLKTLSVVISKVEEEILSFEFAAVGYPTQWNQLSQFWSGKVSHDLQTYILPFALPRVLAKLNQSYSKSISEIAANIRIRQKYIDGLFIRVVTV